AGSDTRTYTITRTYSSVTGEASLTDTGTDSYSLLQTGSTLAIPSYAQTLTGIDTYSRGEAQNDTNGGFDRTLTVNGSYTLVEPPTSTTATHAYNQHEVGNYVDGLL